MKLKISTTATTTNKSPRGLNAHLNWRKLPAVHLGVCHPLEKLHVWPLPWAPWGHVYHLNNSESPTPKDVFWIRWNSYLGPPPPPPGPIGATLWELPWTTLILHIRRIWILHNLTVLLLGLKQRLLWNLHDNSPWEPSPWAPMGATCSIWMTLNPRPLRMIPATFA